MSGDIVFTYRDMVVMSPKTFVGPTELTVERVLVYGTLVLRLGKFTALQPSIRQYPMTTIVLLSMPVYLWEAVFSLVTE